MSSVLRRPDPFALDSHTRDEIALFLAKAALAAGPAVMEEYDRGCEVASKADGSPVTSADSRAEAIICDYLTRLTPLTPLCAEEATAAGVKPQTGPAFPAGRSARRNAGVPCRQRRVYDQRRADREWRSDRWRRVCARNRLAVGRRRHGFRVRGAPRRGAARRRIAAAHSNSSRAIELGRFCKPFASRCPVGRLPQRIAHWGDKVRGFVAEVLPYRGGPRRRLSAIRANDGMGHCGRGRGAARGRRGGPRSFRTTAFVRQDRERYAQWTFHRMGRPYGRQTVRILKSSHSNWGAIN